MTLERYQLRDGRISYHVKFRPAGRTYRLKLGIMTEREALKADAFWKEKLRRGEWPTKSKTPPPMPTLQEFCDHWFLPWYADNRRPRSLDTVRDRLRLHLSHYMGGYALDELTTARIDNYRSRRVRDGAHRQTINGELDTLKLVLRKAREQGDDAGWRLPRVTIQRFPVAHGEKRVLSDAEESRLLLAATPRLRPLIRFALQTGLRRNELLHLRWRDIDWAAREVIVTTDGAKGGRKSRRIPLNSTAIAVLKELRQATLTEQSRIFGYRVIDSTFRKAALKAGLPGVSPHTLRHTMATRALERGINVRTVQKWLGHHDLSLVQLYTHPTPAYEREGIERLADASSVQKRVTFPESLG